MTVIAIVVAETMIVEIETIVVAIIVIVMIAVVNVMTVATIATEIALYLFIVKTFPVLPREEHAAA